MQATDYAKNQSEGMGLDEYVRHCAGLGLVVRVWGYRCASCGNSTAKAHAINRDIAPDLQLIAGLDAMIGRMRVPKCCGGEMVAQPPVMRDGDPLRLL